MKQPTWTFYNFLNYWCTCMYFKHGHTLAKVYCKRRRDGSVVAALAWDVVDCRNHWGIQKCQSIQVCDTFIKSWKICVILHKNIWLKIVLLNVFRAIVKIQWVCVMCMSYYSYPMITPWDPCVLCSNNNNNKKKITKTKNIQHQQTHSINAFGNCTFLLAIF